MDISNLIDADAFVSAPDETVYLNKVLPDDVYTNKQPIYVVGKPENQNKFIEKQMYLFPEEMDKRFHYLTDIKTW